LAVTTDSLRGDVVAALREATKAHESGAFSEIGQVYDRLAQRAWQLADVDPDLRVAIEFLDGWYDSSNHDWQYYDPLSKPDWPRLSLSLAASLEARKPIDEHVRQRFTFAPKRGLWSRVRQFFGGSA
jgi:hypothetical protein